MWAYLLGQTFTGRWSLEECGKEMSPQTKLGWVLPGPATGLSCESTSMSLLSCHTLKVEASMVGCANATLDDTLKKFWDLEAIGIKAEESSVYEELTQNVVFWDGRYCVHLPWKSYHPPLPDNFNLCQTRLFWSDQEAQTISAHSPMNMTT